MDAFSLHQNLCHLTYPTNLRSYYSSGAYVSLMGYPKGTLHIFLVTSRTKRRETGLRRPRLSLSLRSRILILRKSIQVNLS